MISVFHDSSAVSEFSLLVHFLRWIAIGPSIAVPDYISIKSLITLLAIHDLCE